MSATPPNPPELPDVLKQRHKVKSEAPNLRHFAITLLSPLRYLNLAHPAA